MREADQADCSKTVVVLCSERGILDHEGSTGGICKQLKNQAEYRIVITVQNPTVNSKSAVARFYVPFALPANCWKIVVF